MDAISYTQKISSIIENFNPNRLGIYFSLFLHLIILLFAIGLPDLFKPKPIILPNIIFLIGYKKYFIDYILRNFIYSEFKYTVENNSDILIVLYLGISGQLIYFGLLPYSIIIMPRSSSHASA